MMQIKELAVGDWVQNPLGYKAVILDIRRYDDGRDAFRYVVKIGEDGNNWQRLEELLPIPLTPEILEKNGFKETQENSWSWERKIHSNVDIMYIDDYVRFYKEFPSKKNGGLHTGGLITIQSEQGRLDIDGEYVHQLQHALRLCGIEKEIVL